MPLKNSYFFTFLTLVGSFLLSKSKDKPSLGSALVVA